MGTERRVSPVAFENVEQGRRHGVILSGRGSLGSWVVSRGS
jgi:hypothetical protein